MTPARKDVVFDSLRLSISAPTLSCKDVADHMVSCGLMANTTHNLTNIRGKIEEGCSITLNRVTIPQLKRDVWGPLKYRYGLTCAHVHVPGIFTGCVLDFLRPSLCHPPISTIGKCSDIKSTINLNRMP